jgi:GTP-binding protein Era
VSEEAPFRSGFVTLVGRPNAGKSTLLNVILGEKVSIVSDKPQTTRTQVRGVLDRDDAQVVFVDTPGIHKPKTAAGKRFNATARAAVHDVDVVCFLIDATAPMGGGDRFVAERLAPDTTLCVVNKIDAARPAQVLEQLKAAGELNFAEYFPVSAVTGEGVAALLEGIVRRLPEGPRYYPEGTVTDAPDAFWVAELVREQLLAATREELPHSIACRVTELEWPRIRCEILVERESQKGIVIGKRGDVLKRVGTAVREQLRPGAYLELVVKVEPDWQRRPQALDRLGL